MAHERQCEVYSLDRKTRIVVLKRDDGYFQILEEVLRSYESGDEFNPTLIPFPENGSLPEWSMIHGSAVHSLFGSAEDAEAEARRLLRLD
jgi:hypothetical protein